MNVNKKKKSSPSNVSNWWSIEKSLNNLEMNVFFKRWAEHSGGLVINMLSKQRCWETSKWSSCRGSRLDTSSNLTPFWSFLTILKRFFFPTVNHPVDLAGGKKTSNLLSKRKIPSEQCRGFRAGRENWCQEYKREKTRQMVFHVPLKKRCGGDFMLFFIEKNKGPGAVATAWHLPFLMEVTCPVTSSHSLI